MASFGKVLDLLDDRYLELQDVVGNIEPLPSLVPYEKYAENVLVYRMDTNHEIFMGLIQDFTMRRAHEMRKELWTWFVQWGVDSSTPTHQPLLHKKLCLDAQQASAFCEAPVTLDKVPALTVFERRTLDGALMLEEDMLRILIDIVQVASSLVPNFIEFLYRWVDYYEGDGKALKAALRWEIPSLWDFEHHPLVLPQEEGGEAGRNDEYAASGQQNGYFSDSKAAELRQSSPTRKMQARPKPDLAAIELRTLYSEETERLQYREVKFGIQPPKLEQPLPPLINIPRDQYKRIKYYAACFKSRQRALYLLLEAGVTMRQVDSYQKLQTTHPKETSETSNGNGLRNYHKDAKFAQAQFELKEKQIKQREITISNTLAIEAELAASHAIPDGATGLPLIPPTPAYARKSDMAATMLRKIKESRAKNDYHIHVVPVTLIGRLESKVFEVAKQEPQLVDPRELSRELRRYTRQSPTLDDQSVAATDDYRDKIAESESSSDADSVAGLDAAYVTKSALGLPRPSLPRPLPLQRPTPAVLATPMPSNIKPSFEHSAFQTSARDGFVPHNIARYMQTLSTEQVEHLLPLLNSESQQASASRLQEYLQSHGTFPSSLSLDVSTLGLPELQAQSSVLGHLDSSRLLSPTVRGQPSLSSNSLPRYAAMEADRSDSIHSKTTEAPSAIVQPTGPVRRDFDADHFMYLRRLHHISQSATTPYIPEPLTQSMLPTTSITSQTQSIAPPDMRQQTPAQRQRIMSADFAATNAQAPAAEIEANQSNTQPPFQLQHLSVPTESTTDQRRPISSLQAIDHADATQLPTPSLNPSRIGTMFPPPRPGSLRKTPSPLSLLPTNASPLTNLVTGVLATSPFLNDPSLNSQVPIQIYLPKILVPGNGIGPGGENTGDSGCIETDALILGYEDVKTGALVLSKAILLPVGVWENTIRKVRNGRWSVLETYACPSSQAAKDRGKLKVAEKEKGKGCHRAAYDKLAQAYYMISATPAGQREDLTKRWRVSRGPMTSCDRGAVWEGWGTYVDRQIEMSAAERQDALRAGEEPTARIDGGGMVDDDAPNKDALESQWRRKEMEELVDEDV